MAAAHTTEEHTVTNPTYTRGTTTRRVNSKSLKVGQVALTADCPANPQFAANTGTKTGAALRTVASKAVVEPNRKAGERNRRYQITWTDGTTTTAAPSETFAVVDTKPVAKAAKTPASKAEKVAKTSACLHCNLPTRGGDYLPGHDATHASQVYSEIVNGADRAKALKVLPPKLAAKVEARLTRRDTKPAKSAKVVKGNGPNSVKELMSF